MEAKPQDGSTVKGYITLTQEDIEKMNHIKHLSAQFLKYINGLEDVDKRWIAMARTDMQVACMKACRAVSQPSEDS